MLCNKQFPSLFTKLIKRKKSKEICKMFLEKMFISRNVQHALISHIPKIVKKFYREYNFQLQNVAFSSQLQYRCIKDIDDNRINV